MSTRPLLVDSTSAHVVEPGEEIAKLREDLRKLRIEFANLQDLVETDRANIGNLLHAFKSILNGSMDSTSPSATSPLQPPDAAAWQMWKQRLPGVAPKVIDALLIQPLTSTQLITACNSSHASIHRALATLRGNGLIEKDGTRIRLKRL